MALLVGIDEAGFGPLLGPLVVSGVAFRVPDDALDACLWDTLRQSCTARVSADGGRSHRRIVVADSKKLHRPGGGPGALEKTALVMLAAAGHRPTAWRALMELLAPGAGKVLERYPWYRGTDVTLPVSSTVGDIATQANAVRRDCVAHGVHMNGALCEAVTVGQYNRLVERTRNKAVVLTGQVFRIVDRVLRAWPDPNVRVCVDRLGGRVHYREALTTALPAHDLTILEESSHRSAYRLTFPSRTCRIEFIAGGDRRHFAVALASVFSKYVRELYMYALNRHWCRCVPGLAATAGYYTDARRWLSDAAEALARLSVDRSLLVRLR
ncbi:MAG: hypothetical protein ACE5EX_06480 [Phycisphaerae bacterium]